jgi:hypothetical protein
MPVKLNVGLNRKVGESNYGSRGASVNLELELDSGLINDPAKLKDRIRQLFDMVRTSLAEELHVANGNGHQPVEETRSPPDTNGNGHAPRTQCRRQATPAQVKAIYAIARSRHTNLVQFLRGRFEVNRPDDLSITEASQVIDELKATGDEQN